MSDWVANVDKYLDDNSVRGGISNRAGMGAFYVWIFKMSFYICTLGVGYILALMLRTKEMYFFELVRSKNHPSQNLDDNSVKKRIDKILESEMVSLKKGEEVLYLLEDGDDSDCGMVFTDARVIYNLLKPKAITISQQSGQFPIQDMASKVQAKLKVYVMITVNGEDIGKLAAEKGQPIEDFLNAVRKAVTNAKFA